MAPLIKIGGGIALRSIDRYGRFSICLLVFMLALSGCGGECISTTDSSELEGGSLKICSNPNDVSREGCLEYMTSAEGSHDDTLGYWVKTNIELEDGNVFEYQLQESEDYAFCDPPCPDHCFDEQSKNLCDTNSCKAIDLDFPNIKEVNLSVLPGDELLIGLRPALNPGIVNSAICEGKDPRVYIGNYGDCINQKGEPYSSLIALGHNSVVNLDTPLAEFKVMYSLDPLRLFNWEGPIFRSDVCKAVLFGDSEAKEAAKEYAAVIDILKRKIAGNQLYRYCKKFMEDAGHVVVQAYEPIVENDEDSKSVVLRGLEIIGYRGNHAFYLCPSFRIPGLCQRATSGFFENRPTLFLNTFFPVTEVFEKFRFSFLNIGSNFNAHGMFYLKVSRKCKNPGASAVNVYIGNAPPSFKPSVSNNSGTLVKPNTPVTAGEGSFVYVGIADPRGNKKVESRGYVLLEYQVKREKIIRIFSKATNTIKSKIIRILYNRTVDESGKFSDDNPGGAVGTVYKAIAGGVLIKAVQASIVLYMTVYGLAFLFGLVKTPQADLIVFLVKLGIVAVLFGPNSWKFFNEHLFALFVEGSSQLINYVSGDDSGVDLAFLDRVLSPFGSQRNWARIFSFLFSGGLGILYFVFIIVGLILIVKAMFTIIIAYFMSIVMVAILLCLAPIFISMIFFKRTKAIFDNWIKNLAQVSITPVITFAAFALLSEVALGIVAALFNFQICPVCVIEPQLLLFKFCLLAVYLPTSYDAGGGILAAQNAGGMPVGIGLVIAFLVISNAIMAFASHASILSSSIFGAIASDTTIPAEQFMDSMKAIVGQDSQAKYQKAEAQHRKSLDGEKDEPEEPPKRKR